MSGADESVVIVDERNQVVGTAMAATCGQKDSFTAAPIVWFSILPINSSCTSARPAKTSIPGCYDPAVRGVVLAGESYDTRRRVGYS
jgi:hypothetical protein